MSPHSSALRDVYWKEQFRPGLLGLFINPFYFARKGLFEAIQPVALKLKGRLLDVGCGQKPYEGLFEVNTYIGLEFDAPGKERNKKADIYYDGTKFPFSNADFDSVLCNQVLEHVFDPDLFLAEINRVLRTGGLLLITVPFVWDEHEQPYDYARYSSFGLLSLLRKHGFEILEHKKTMMDVRAIFQMVNTYIHKTTTTRNRWVNLAVTVIVMSPFNILGELLAALLPRNSDLYLDNVVLAKKSS